MILSIDILDLNMLVLALNNYDLTLKEELRAIRKSWEQHKNPLGSLERAKELNKLIVQVMITRKKLSDCLGESNEK